MDMYKYTFLRIYNISIISIYNLSIIKQAWYLIWKVSLPQCLVRYLLQQILAASMASEDSCSNSSDTF